MNDFSSNLSISLLNQPMPATLARRRVNFYIAKPKGKSLAETADMPVEIKPLVKSSLTLKNTFACAGGKMMNQTKPAQDLNNDNTQKRKCIEIELKTETEKNNEAQFHVLVGENNKQNSVTQYQVKIDKNLDTKVNALIAELDSKGSILLRNSFLCEEPIAWQRCPPFSKKSPKRSLSILSANYLQFDDALKTGKSTKDLLGFPDPNIALLASIDYGIDMKMMSDLVFSRNGDYFATYETDSDSDIEFYSN